MEPTAGRLQRRQPFPHRNACAAIGVGAIIGAFGFAQAAQPGDAPSSPAPAVTTTAGAPSPPRVTPGNGASSEQIAGWLRDLGSDQFRVRDEAMQRLIGAGEGAIEPLKTALTTADPEVVSRGIHVLAALVKSESLELQDVAFEALRELSDARANTVARRASLAVAESSELLSDRALERFIQLGATIQNGGVPFGNFRRMELGAAWQGKESDLRLLRRLYGVTSLIVSGGQVTDMWLAYVAEMPDLEALQISRGKITAAGIGHLKQAKNLNELVLTRVPIGDDAIDQFAALPATKMDLFGTRLSKAGFARLKQALPNSTLQYRGVFLGIKSQSSMGWSIIAVEPETPAEKAGLRPGDIIRKFAGTEVPEFETLTTLIAAREPGDRVEVEILRMGEIIKTTVVFE